MHESPVSQTLSHDLRKLSENVGRAGVNDGMDCIETQAIEVIFLQPVERIVNEEIPYDTAVRAVKVDCVSPRGVMTIGEELWRVRRR